MGKMIKIHAKAARRFKNCKSWIITGGLSVQAQNQIVETEHLFKALLEQPNGLARRILSKAGSNATDMLDKTDVYIRSQPRVSGDSAQVFNTALQIYCSVL